MAQYIGKAIRDESGVVTGYDNIRRIEGNNARPRGDWDLLYGDLTKYPKVEFIDSYWMVTEDEAAKTQREAKEAKRLDDHVKMRAIINNLDAQIDDLTTLAKMRTFLKLALPKLIRRILND